MEHKVLFLLAFVFIFNYLQGQTPLTANQKRTVHWYFGDGAGLDFSTGNPVPVTDGKLHTREGCATMSDTLGNLLFYTDGDTVWNRNHQPMPNGTGLMGGCGYLGSTAQACAIIPYPGHDSLDLL